MHDRWHKKYCKNNRWHNEYIKIEKFKNLHKSLKSRIIRHGIKNVLGDTNFIDQKHIEEVIDLDKRTNEAWSKHKNLKRVEATDIIDEKIDKVIKLIHEYLNIK